MFTLVSPNLKEIQMTILEFKRKEKHISENDGPQANNPPPQGFCAIGIDLGTTNSAVSLFYPESTRPVTLDYEGSHLVPSLVYFDPELQKDIVGQQAKTHLNQDPENVIKSTKRHMGKSLVPFHSNGKSYLPEDIATLILSYLVAHPTVQDEKNKFGGIWAVITVPAHFDDASRRATISAAQRAGISILRIINEPTAAALAYTLVSDEQKKDETLAVFDFGGGTFDVTIVDRHDLAFRVLSSNGDVRLGGDDVDEALADFMLKKVTPPFVARRANKNSEIFRKILLHAESTKKALQTEGSVHILDNKLDAHGTSLDIEITREEFEEMISPVLEKTLFLTESSLHAAKRSPKNISRILLVGGSTRLNLIRKMLSDYFHCMVDARLEPDLAVSWGACLQSAIILGIQVDTILVDVCSHSLGIGVVEDGYNMSENFKISDLKVAPILHRNSSLPAKKSEFFTTVAHNQNAVHVIVVQGENDTVGENRLIGSFLFPLEQPCSKGTKCEIQLTYDTSGMVSVFVKQLGTKNEAKAHFDSRTGEVLGWAQLHSTTPEPAEKEMTPIAEDQNTEVKGSVVSVINAILVRAKRHLAQLETSSEEYERISRLSKTYSALLMQAQQGAHNDEEIEHAETQLLDALKGK